MNKSNTLWVFIDDSKSDNEKYFLTMFIVTEHSNFDNDVRIMKSRIRKYINERFTNEFLRMPKHYTYKRLSKNAKHIVNNTLTDINEKIIEHSFLSRKISNKQNINFYYKDHIRQITQFVMEKYKHKYKRIIFDHGSTNKVDDLIAYENENVTIKPGNDLKDTGLIIVDLLRSKITF